ncbi:hypothetical protein [Mycobacterium sp.]|uniref:hypothetical protein n=1 Tax=Mycobacterium sp. TaxID=1785 RepID=UPI003BAB597F
MSAAAAADLQLVGAFFDISTARVYEVNQNGVVCPEEPDGTHPNHESAQQRP